jgi:hypothetical protein
MSENGFLSDVDKEFLRGEKEYDSKQSRYDRRHAIRERTRAAFRDFSLLNKTLDPEERNKIMNIPTSPEPTYADTGLAPETEEGFVNMIAFAYLALEGELDGLSPRELPTVPSFEELLESSVSRAATIRHVRAGLRHSVTSTEFSARTYGEWDAPRAAAKLARGYVESLTEAELRALVQPAADYIDKWGERDGLSSLVEAKREELESPPDPRHEVPEWFADSAAGGEAEGDLPERDEELSDRERVEMIVRLDRTGYSIDEILDIVGAVGSHSADES